MPSNLFFFQKKKKKEEKLSYYSLILFLHLSLIDIAPSNNFLGLLPPPYSMSTLKSTLPIFQTSSLSSSSSTSYTNPYSSQTLPNHTSYSYRSNSPLYPEVSSYSMSSSMYRSAPSSSSSAAAVPLTSGLSIPKPSQFHQTREKEKFELSTLNDKFADYVEKVRYLEAQNKKVQMETTLLNEKQQNNCQRIKTMFENELAQLKETVDKLFKDKNTLSYAAKDAQVSYFNQKTVFFFIFLFRIQNAIHPLRQRLTQTFKECDSSKYDTEKIERQLSSVEGDILMYKRRLAHQDDEHTQWKQLITHVQRLLLQAKNETHNETLARSTTEQTIKQLRLDLTKLRDQHQQKLQDLKQTSLIFAPNSNNDRAHMFKSELSSAIRKIRQDFEKQNDQQRNELYVQFTQDYDNIARQYPDLAHLFLNEREQERIKQDEDRVRTDLQRIKTESSLLKQKNADLKLRTRELQINLEMSVDENKRFEQLQQNEIDQMKLKQERISKDYEEVITKQTSLEKEIETYRNLLEGTMKTVVDTITDEYNSSQTNQTKTTTTPQQHNTYSQRAARSSSVDRNSSSPYISSSRYNGHPNAYSRFTTFKSNGIDSTATEPAVDIPVTNENGLAQSKSVGDLSTQNGLTTVETNGITNGSSPPSTRPTTILQTRRN